jgi:spore coat polysaccharide biosynthesis protein SpsF
VKPTVIIQARAGSTRLPGKVLKLLANNRTVLEYTVRRCQLARGIAEVAVATSDRPGDDAVADLARSLGVRVCRGSEADVLDRYVNAARTFEADPIVRVTADSPLVDPDVIERCLGVAARTGCDYAWAEGYPLGLASAELVTRAALERAHAETRPDETYFREHAVTYVTGHPERFRVVIEPAAAPAPPYRLTIDESLDFEVLSRICEAFAPRLEMRTKEIVAFCAAHPEVVAINQHVKQRS